MYKKNRKVFGSMKKVINFAIPFEEKSSGGI